MSGIADSPTSVSCGAFQPLRFNEYLARVNQGERIERAAGRRTPTVAAEEECPRTCPPPPTRDEFRPRLADVSPVDATDAHAGSGHRPLQRAEPIAIEQLLPTGSIIDVTV